MHDDVVEPVDIVFGKALQKCRGRHGERRNGGAPGPLAAAPDIDERQSRQTTGIGEIHFDDRTQPLVSRMQNPSCLGNKAELQQACLFKDIPKTLLSVCTVPKTGSPIP